MVPKEPVPGRAGNRRCASRRTRRSRDGPGDDPAVEPDGLDRGCSPCAAPSQESPTRGTSASHPRERRIRLSADHPHDRGIEVGSMNGLVHWTSTVMSGTTPCSSQERVQCMQERRLRARFVTAERGGPVEHEGTLVRGHRRQDGIVGADDDEVDERRSAGALTARTIIGMPPTSRMFLPGRPGPTPSRNGPYRSHVEDVRRRVRAERERTVSRRGSLHDRCDAAVQCHARPGAVPCRNGPSGSIRVTPSISRRCRRAGHRPADRGCR